MKPLSEVLTELAERMKKVEDSATAARDNNREALKKRSDELANSIGSGLKQFEDSVGDVQQAAEKWWLDLRGSIEQQVSVVRSDYDKKQKERSAKQAEEDAQGAAALAGYLLEAAEWAAVQAELARAEADDSVQA